MGLAAPFLSSDRLDRQSGGFPLGIAVFEPADQISACPQSCDGLERENAVGTATIGDHLAIRRKFAQPAFQFGKRNVERAGKMPDCELVLWTNIEDRDKPILQL